MIFREGGKCHSSFRVVESRRVPCLATRIAPLEYSSGLGRSLSVWFLALLSVMFVCRNLPAATESEAAAAIATRFAASSGGKALAADIKGGFFTLEDYRGPASTNGLFWRRCVVCWSFRVRLLVSVRGPLYPSFRGLSVG